VKRASVRGTRARAAAVLSSALPDGFLHLELPPLEVDVAPAQTQHLTAPQACVAAEQNDKLGACVDGACGFEQAHVIVDVVELHRTEELPEDYLGGVQVGGKEDPPVSPVPLEIGNH
jgi:hypothetical protein